MTAAEALHHPWLRSALSRPPSPDGEHTDPIKLPLQRDFIKADKGEEAEEKKDGGGGLEAPPTLERRPTFVDDPRDTRVAV